MSDIYNWIIEYKDFIGTIAALCAIFLFIWGIVKWPFKRKTLDQNPPPNITNNTGYTVEQHERVVKERLAEKEEILERAHGAEKELLVRDVTTLKDQLLNIQASYESAKKEIENLKAQLQRSSNLIGAERLKEAHDALERGDLSVANAIFAEISARNELAIQETARAEYGQGQIAEIEYRWQDAKVHFKRSYELEDSIKHVSAYGDILRFLGEHVEARDLFERRLSTIAGTSSIDYAKLANNLATVLQDQGQYAEAEKIHLEVLEIRQGQLGEDHPSTAASMNYLAEVFSAQGKYVEAEKLYRDALEIHQAQHGKGHTDTAISMNNLAGAFVSQGKYVEAEKLLRDALEVFEAQFGKNHPDISNSTNNLAEVLRVQGQCDEAKKLHREVLEIRRKQLGKDHSDTIISMNNLAATLYAQGQYAEAEKLFREAFEVYQVQRGKDHPETAVSMNNLARILQAQRRYSEAEGLICEALAIAERRLGVEHPHSIKIRENLEVLLQEKENHQ